MDVLRVALSEYVDTAMVRAYGDRWDHLVAEEDAKRRKDGRRFPVRKNDLAVMLKALMHRRIEPWSSLREHQRLRAFASEILTLRNLHAHGDECADEYSRLLDTAGRMLTLLGIPVPPELQPPRRELAKIPGGQSPVPLAAQQPPTSRLDAEIEHLGDVGQQVATIFAKAGQLSQALRSNIHDAMAALNTEAPDLDAFGGVIYSRYAATGEEAIGLLAELERIELAGAEPKDPVLAMLVLLARSQLTEELGTQIAAHEIDLLRQQGELRDSFYRREHELFMAALDSEDPQDALESLPDLDVEEDPDYRRLQERQDEIERLMGAMGSDDFPQAIQQAASQLDDASALANMALGMVSIDAAWAAKDEHGRWTREALPHLRDAISRLRFEAGMAPGTTKETILARVLRLEGEVYNDIGQPDDALQSFARAAEIIDRYPSADPDLLA